jgi:RNA polymerase sigma-70 factor (ECF subfamily)
MEVNFVNEDIDLIKEILDGNMDSFNILVNKYEIVIFRFIYNIIRDTEASQDITQETFITAYNKLYTYKHEYKFINWMFQIAKNKSIDYMRKYRRVYEVNIEDVQYIQYTGISPEQSAEYSETKYLVEEFVKGLNETDRQILSLKYLKEETTFTDIAEILSMSESAVKARFYRLKDRFKTFKWSGEKRCKI